MGALVLVVLVTALALIPLVGGSAVTKLMTVGETPTVPSVVALFSTIGAFTFGGGLSMIALMEEHMVSRLHWLTPQEFLAGLALGQLTPGPVLMLAAYVGYKLLGPGGAIVAAAAAFLPSFVLMLAVLPAFDRLRNLTWAKGVIEGIVPGVIGVMAVALVRMTPAAAPDPLAITLFIGTVVVLLIWRLQPLKLMLAGALVGIARHRLFALGRM
jgi:chromate transporter